MQDILYTDTDQIRSVLGLDEKDLSDEQITDRNIEKELNLDLVGWMGDHAVVYNTGTDLEASSVEKNIADALILYATYYCCGLTIVSLQMATPQAVSDGKNSLSRFTPSNWQEIENTVKERAAFYKKLLQELTSSITSASSPTLLTGAGLAVDPVTSG